MELGKEFSAAVSRNLMLKSRILSVIIFSIFSLQIIGATVLVVSGKLNDFVNPAMFWTGPLLMLCAFITEFYFYRSTKKNLSLGLDTPSNHVKFSYLVVLVEVSFPSIIIFFASRLVNPVFFKESGINLLNSPPFIMYFIMIILNSLSLNFWLCVFAGVVAGAEYLVLSLHYRYEGNTDYTTINMVIKAVLIAVCGIITGFVSKKIKEAVLLSLKSKEALITKLDSMVNEKTAEIRSQKDEIEEKNKDIVSSISYAQRIQRAVLPTENVLTQWFPDSMIFYKPKDIVSGDFYWEASLDGGFMFCVADCTGHGVPGAFMSLLNISKLNETVNEKGITEPHLVLNSVRTEIIKALESAEQNTYQMQDGMDCTLIYMRKNSSQLLCAAANNPLCIVDKNEITEILFDKFPVGKSPKQDVSFSLQSVTLEKDQSVYMFTDGFADQFGGPKGKKFKYKQLKVLLAAHSADKFEEQKKLLEEVINVWRGDLEQVDDMLISGFRI